MRAGNLRKRAEFFARVKVDDGAGGATEQWISFVTLWAQLVPERAKEKIQAGRVAEASAATLRVRSWSKAREITREHRVVVDGRTYDIADITNPDQRNRMIEMALQNVIAE